jgi:hypothetical protein
MEGRSIELSKLVRRRRGRPAQYGPAICSKEEAERYGHRREGVRHIGISVQALDTGDLATAE